MVVKGGENVILTLKTARLLRKLSQKQVAEKANITAEKYSYIEGNPSTATIKQAKALSEVLGFSYDLIFFG
jgi:transcriptional regulator with XRE-family HTH domain